MSSWKTPIPEPHPLTRIQRLGVLRWRALMTLFKPLSRLTGGSANGPVALRRYGDRPDETVQILHPPVGIPRQTPVVYIHGGGWICGHKEVYTGALGFLTLRGHTVYNLDYPLAPEHPHPVPLISLVRALRFVADREEMAGPIHLMGDSAGGNLAAMLGILLASPAHLEALHPPLRALALPRVASVVSLYGVLDRLSWLEHGFPSAALMLHSYGGFAAFEPSVGDELAITPMDLELDAVVDDLPPCLLAIGTEDPLAESTRIAHAHLSALGADARLLTYEGEAHGFFNMVWREAAAELRLEITDFLDGVDAVEPDPADADAKDTPDTAGAVAPHHSAPPPQPTAPTAEPAP